MQLLHTFEVAYNIISQTLINFLTLGGKVFRAAAYLGYEPSHYIYVEITLRSQVDLASFCIQKGGCVYDVE